MKNIEFYAKEIKDMKSGYNVCDKFIRPIILGGSCGQIDCDLCHLLSIAWAFDEYQEPEPEPEPEPVDWSKVPVDIKIYVRD